MTFAFIKLRFKDMNIVRYMDITGFNNHRDILKDCDMSIVTFDNIYIACFNRFESLESILTYNPDATLGFEISLNDIFFKNLK